MVADACRLGNHPAGAGYCQLYGAGRQVTGPCECCLTAAARRARLLCIPGLFCLAELPIESSRPFSCSSTKCGPIPQKRIFVMITNSIFHRVSSVGIK